MGYEYRGDKKLTPAELIAMARAEADNIIAAAKDQAIQEAQHIRERAYDQGLALAERTYASRDDRLADQQRAKEAVLKRAADKRLRAASFEVAGAVPLNTKPVHKLENVEYLVSAGCSVEEALQRSGYHHLDSFKRAAYRHGRNDLIRYVSEQLAS